MADPLISIVMPAYKAADSVADAAGSVLAQSWTRLELIVVSDDGVDYLDVLDQAGLADERTRQASTGGVGTGDWNARNVGLAAATGDLVTIIDADDAYAPGRLAALAPLALADGAALDNTEMQLNGSRMATLLHPKEAASGEPVPATAPLILRDRVPVFPMWRRRDFDLHWHELPHASDVILSLELLSAAPDMRVAPDMGYRYLKRQGSMTLSDSMTDRSREAYFRIMRAILDGTYDLAPAVADLALYEIAKNLNQAVPFARAMAADPGQTHETLAITFNERPMTEAERYAYFQGEDAP